MMLSTIWKIILVSLHPETSVGWVTDILETTFTIQYSLEFRYLDICPTLVYIYGTCKRHMHRKITNLCVTNRPMNTEECHVFYGRYCLYFVQYVQNCI